MNDYNIVRKNGTDLFGELKKLELDPIYDPKKELKIYEMRKNPNYPIVQVYAAEKL